MAGATSRIRLGSAVIVLPLYQPMRVAQEIALVDQLSGGRVVLGVGTGYQPFEFARYGVDVEDRTAVFLKSWDVLEEALTTGMVTDASTTSSRRTPRRFSASGSTRAPTWRKSFAPGSSRCRPASATRPARWA